MEYGEKPEIQDENLALAKELIHAFGFGEHADRKVTYGGQEMTIAEGMAMHWHETAELDGEEVFKRISMYIGIADQQSV